MMHLPLFADIALFPYEPPWLTALVLLSFLLFMGGCIGSFLNVVIYRLPAGLSIVKPRSRCPRCLTPILARDNLPVIGWLLLRGRCRFCKTRIPARYPLVEAAAGLAFAVLCVGEAIYPGAILPIPRAVALGDYPLFGSAMYHFALVCGLGAAGMMAHDRAVVPVGYWRVVLLVGLLPPLFLPSLRPIAGLSLSPGYGRFVLGLLDGCLGTLVGALLGAASWPVSTLAARARSGHLNGVAALASVGAFLGWQAAAGISLATALLIALRGVARQFGVRLGATWPLVPAVVTLMWLMFWRPIVGLAVVGKWVLFGPESPAWFAAAAVAATFVLSLAARRLSLISSPDAGASQPLPRATRLN